MTPLLDLFAQELLALDHFFNTVDPLQVERVFERVQKCRGSLLLTGVGKSGHIAEKVAATLLSTGTRAFFLPPANALHGDLGLASSGDLALLFSKSGASEELIQLVLHLERRGVETIALVSEENSRLAHRANLSLYLPVLKEICPYDLAPTTSTAIQLIFGDCLAVALMKAKRFSLHDFAANHPGGGLGRKISLKVADLMLKGGRLPLAHPSDLLVEVLHELSAKRCGCLLIIEKGSSNLFGIFTDGDLRRALEKGGANALHRPLAELMTPSPRTISSGALAFEALQEMQKDRVRPITVLPVVEEGGVVGLIRLHDILQTETSSP